MFWGVFKECVLEYFSGMILECPNMDFGAFKLVLESLLSLGFLWIS